MWRSSTSTPRVQARMLSAKAKISAANVKIVRGKTGLPMKICRQALEATGNDAQAALQWIEDNAELRAEKAQSKLGEREVSQGRIALRFNAAGTQAGMAHLGCETDFVCRNSTFEELSLEVASAALAAGGTPGGAVQYDLLSAETLAQLPAQSGGLVDEHIKSTLSTVGENVVLHRGCAFGVDTGAVGGYVHGFGSYACLVGLDATRAENTAAVAELCGRIAQHIVAVDPGVSLALATEEGHQQSMQALLDAPYLFDGDVAVGDMIASESAKLSEAFKLKGFVRWGLEDKL